MPPVSLSQDYFSFFGIPRKLSVDTSDLQSRFYSLSRQFHPDRFARGSVADQQYALDATALLNDAYRVLRDPVQRAEYLLAQEGFTVEWEKKDGAYQIHEISCPYYQIGVAHPEVCTVDQTLISKMLALPANKVQCILDGGAFCTYVVQPAVIKN